MVSLEKLTAISSHYVIRDKSVKIIQYSSRILTGYYRDSLSRETHEALTFLTSTCSLGRKVFRLLKSVNSLNTLSIKLAALGPWYDVNLLSRQVVDVIEVLEHFIWSIFFWFDNILFLGRTKLLVPYDAKISERRTYDCWALADSFGLLRRLLKLGFTRFDMSKIQALIDSAQVKRLQVFREEEVRAARESIIGVTGGAGRSSSSRKPLSFQLGFVSLPSEEEIALLSHQLASLQFDQRCLLWDILRSICDLGVSGSWWMKTDNGKWLLNEKLGIHGLGEGGQGVCGVVSSLMTISDLISGMS